MADLNRRGSYVSRSTREKRAQRLAIVGGGAGVLGVIGIVLSIVGIGSFGISVLLLVVAALCGFFFQRTVS